MFGKQNICKYVSKVCGYNIMVLLYIKNDKYSDYKQ